MHISLDSALGQQRRLNSVGESITQIAPDPAAAYSLRSLTGGDPKVVRVRRGSDNHEQDFTASDVSSGALVDFVNAQVVAPLDIQALSATGRDGDFLIAKAAYSLRSLGTRQAQITTEFPDTFIISGAGTTAVNGTYVKNGNSPNSPLTIPAYTLFDTDGTTALFSLIGEFGGDTFLIQGTPSGGGDTYYEGTMDNNDYALNASDTGSNPVPSVSTTQSDKYVVSVRRSSDGFHKQFTATEITDGTLVSFVGSGFISNGVFANTGFETFTNASATGFSATNTSSTGFAISTITAGASGDVVTVTFDLDLVSGDPALSLRTGGGTGSGASNSIIYTSSGSYTSVFTATGSFDKLGFSEGNTSSEFTVSNLKVTTKDGFVKTWYDQSVTTQAGDTATGNHATQATAANQPKIVSAGSLVSGGLEFDGSNDFFGLTSSITQSGAFSYFFALDGLVDAPRTLVGTSGGATPRVRCESSNLEIKSSATEINYSTSVWTANSGKSLVSFNRNGSNSASAHRDGVEIGTAGSMSGNLTHDRLFKLDDANSANFTGKCQEVIIYDTDQTDNRTAIEANIGEVYSIDLPSGVDPGFDQVDGFVETWYDQSGNGKDATQATAGNQPKIVEAGALVTKLGQASIDFTTSTTFLFNDPFSITETESAVFAIWQPAKDSATASEARNRTLFSNVASQIFIGSPNSNNEMSFKRFGAVQNFTLAVASLNTPNLHAFVGTTSGADYYFNGSSIHSDTATGTNNTRNDLYIGTKQNITSHDTEGYISEFVIYNSDQSSNRTAIEANIISHYGIS